MTHTSFLNIVYFSLISLTGSGKTWTCFGPSPSEASYQPNNRGLVQRACEEIFQASEERQQLGIESKLSVSYVEVYGNEVTDLLKNGERVGHNKVSSQRYVRFSWGFKYHLICKMGLELWSFS